MELSRGLVKRSNTHQDLGETQMTHAKLIERGGRRALVIGHAYHHIIKMSYYRLSVARILPPGAHALMLAQ
jgi:hypothetical protein